MTAKARLKKLEAAAGVDQPCHYCGAFEAQGRAETGYLVQQGVKLPPVRLVEAQCQRCGRVKLCATTGLDEEAIAFYAAYRAEAYRARCEGRKIPDEMEAQSDLFDKQAEDQKRAIYGKHYVAARLAGLVAFENYVATYEPSALASVRQGIAIIKQRLLAESTAEGEANDSE